MAVGIFNILEIIWGILLSVFFAFEGLARWIFPAAFVKSIKDDVVLVTGGGSGIGRLIALKMAKMGAIIVTWDINKAENEKTVKMITEKGGLAFSFTVDLTSRKKIYEAARIVKDQIGPICILVNNAGVLSGTSFLDTPDENIIRTFEVNVLAHFWTIKAFMPDMIANKKGHIVSIASIGGHIGADKMVDYCSSKFASVGLDESLKVELKVQGHSDYIKTTVVCPYIFSTPLSAGMKSKIIPILEPEFVAEQAVQGIITNKPGVIIPWWGAFLITLKTITPLKATFYFAQVCGMNTLMEEFVGRQ